MAWVYSVLFTCKCQEVKNTDPDTEEISLFTTLFCHMLHTVGAHFCVYLSDLWLWHISGQYLKSNHEGLSSDEMAHCKPVEYSV